MLMYSRLYWFDNNNTRKPFIINFMQCMLSSSVGSLQMDFTLLRQPSNLNSKQCQNIKIGSVSKVKLAQEFTIGIMTTYLQQTQRPKVLLKKGNTENTLNK